MSNVRKNIKNKALTGVVRYAPKRVIDLTKNLVPRIRNQTTNLKGRIKNRSDKGRKRVKNGVKKAIVGIAKKRRKRR